MQATITYLLTEQAQRAQMAATGRPVPRKQKHVIEILPDDLDLVKADHDGNLSADLEWLGFASTKAAGEASSPEQAWDAYRRECRRIKAAEREEREEAAREKAERLSATEAADAAAAAWIDGNQDTRAYDYEVRAQALKAAGVEAPNWNASLRMVDAALERRRARIAEIVRRKEEAEAAKEAAEAAKEKAKAAYIAEWIESHADAEIREQFRDGLLARADALTMIADAAFRDIGLDEYKPVICEDRNCACGRTDIDALPRSAYPAWKKIKAVLPAGSAWEMEEVRECLRGEEDDWAEGVGKPEYAALIKLPVGPFVFKRLVRLNAEAAL